MSDQYDFLSKVALSRVGSHNPWQQLKEQINWNIFDKLLSETDCTDEYGERPPYDPAKMFRVILLGQWHDLSDEDLEYSLKVRLDFLLFCGFSMSDKVPDRTTINLFRNKLVSLNLLDKCLKELNQELERVGIKIKTGKLVLDSTVIESAAQPRNTIEPSDDDTPPTKTTSEDPDSSWRVKEVRNKPLTPKEIKYNKIISTKRFIVEQYFGTKKRKFNFGIWLLSSEKDDDTGVNEQFKKLRDWFITRPIFLWVFTGFFVCYLLFFINPIFLNEFQKMVYLVEYIPEMNPIGNDLTKVIDLTKGWFEDGQSPYPKQFYPPFTYVFFSLLMHIGNNPNLFLIFTLFSIVAYALLSLVLPVYMSKTKNLPMILIFFLTGLVSFGFQFEIERGQYNIITFLLCMLSIYIFHTQKKYRFLAYILFTLSVQLKLYPAIFIFMFVDSWKEWKITLRRLIGIGVLNFAFFFIMGWKIFVGFTESVFAQITTATTWSIHFNHSIRSFIDLLGQGKLPGFPISWQTAAYNFESQISITLSILFLICLFLALWLAEKRNKNSPDMYLLLTCSLGALILPISMDYKLSILGMPMALFFSHIPDIKNSNHKLLKVLIILSISISYGILLVPSIYRPETVINSFPLLFIILILVTVVNLLNFKDEKTS